MGRVINIDSTGKNRNYHRRTIAELLRRLSQQQDITDETRDMVAAVVFSLRAIDAGIESSAAAWEKRDYWIKADNFRSEWGWVGQVASDITQMAHDDQWENLPQIMAQLIPRFADIKVAKFTRKPELWRGAYDELMGEKSA
jgi:hypothetical protein